MTKAFYCKVFLYLRLLNECDFLSRHSKFQDKICKTRQKLTLTYSSAHFYKLNFHLIHNIFYRWRHHSFLSAKVLATRVTLMTMKRNRCGSPLQRSAQRSLPTSEFALLPPTRMVPLVHCVYIFAKIIPYPSLPVGCTAGVYLARNMTSW